MRLFVRLEYEQKYCVSCSTYFVPIPKYMAPLSSEPEKMLAMLNKIDSLKITQIKLRERGPKKTKWTFTNQKRASYIIVTYNMGGSTMPDGITERELKVNISGVDNIASIERLH